MPVAIPVNQSLGGETGVHTHINTLREYLSGRQIDSEVFSPYESARWKRRFLGATLKSIDKFDSATRLRVQMRAHMLLLRSQLRDYHTSNGGMVYAQDPVAAEASLTLAQTTKHRTVAAVHFNVSQADENVERGLISPGDQTYRAIQKRETRSLLGADGIVYVSHFMKNTLEKRIPGLNHRRSIVVPNFICDFSTDAAGSIPSRDLISIGTLEARKNHEYVLRVLAAAHSRGRRYTLDILGKGHDLARLQQLASDLGIAPSVRILGFVKDASRMMPDYRAYAHSALIESFGITLLEALRAGLPVLAPAVGGIPEVFQENQGGSFWPIDDPERGADMLIALLSRPDYYKEQSASARRRFETHFRPDVLSGRLIDFLEEVNGGFPESRKPLEPMALGQS